MGKTIIAGLQRWGGLAGLILAILTLLGVLAKVPVKFAEYDRNCAELPSVTARVTACEKTEAVVLSRLDAISKQSELLDVKIDRVLLALNRK